MSTQGRTIAKVRYGCSADQEADLHLPAAQRPPVVCLLHGGFWKMPYGRDQLAGVAEDLASHGLAVWNMEYSRIGTGGGWPRTMEDVDAGIDYLGKLSDDGVDLRLDQVAVVGHSAGGHLALCVAAWRRERSRPAGRVRLRAVIGLAPIADLALAYESAVGGEVVAEFVGGSPSQRPELYRSASPAAMLPLGIRQLIVHGTDDDVVPVAHSRRYVQAAVEAGDRAELIELSGAGHMDYLDSASKAHASVRQWLLARMAEG